MEMDFSQIPPATTPEEADQWFAVRVQVVTNYNACRSQLAGELFKDELDTTTIAIAKLEKARQKMLRLRTNGVSSLRQFRITHGFDPGGGLRKFIGEHCPGAGISSFRSLIKFDDDRCCDQAKDNITQVNEFLLRSQVRSNVGSSGDFPCKRTGEYDVALRGLITIMYRYHQFLWPKVKDHVLHNLLTQKGKHDPGIETVECPGFSVPETENHILMIETSRYLTNQLLFEDARNKGRYASEFDNEKNGMTEWILRKLQEFLSHDFSEYNSRPYQVYSTMAIQNLYDFADDHDPQNNSINRVRLAAQMVLDYLSAKFAVSSNGLRRAVPFRRRKENKDRTILFDDNCDPQTQRFIILSGLTQRLAELQPPFHTIGGRDLMQLAAVGKYRVPDMILDLVMNKAHKSYYQRFRHAAVELYASSPRFLISAGGIWIPSVHGYDEYNDYGDVGWALPTTLMPTEGGIDRDDFIRISGSWNAHIRVNTGVAPGFACGLNPFIPESYVRCSNRREPWTFIDASGRCDNNRAFGFYVAVYESLCTTAECSRKAGSRTGFSRRGTFGFFEVISSDNLDFETFQKIVLERNESRTYTSEGINEYVTVDGRTIRFIPNPPEQYRWAILGESSDPPELAKGDIVNSDGHTGLITIDNPFLHTKIILDMRDHMNPRRSAPIPGLRRFLTTHGFDPSRGVREFIREFWPGVSSLRVLIER